MTVVCIAFLYFHFFQYLLFYNQAILVEGYSVLHYMELNGFACKLRNICNLTRLGSIPYKTLTVNHKGVKHVTRTSSERKEDSSGRIDFSMDKTGFVTSLTAKRKYTKSIRPRSEIRLMVQP